MFEFKNVISNFRRKPREIKPAFKSPETRKVTDRTYKQYLDHFCLPESELFAKQILDIGSGMSDFSSEVNTKFKDSGSISISLDPLYQSLGKDFNEFEKNISKAGMELKSITGDPTQTYSEIKKTPYKVSGSHQELPFKNNSFDLILANNSITQYKDREITKKALAEAIRTIKEDGEIRVQPANLRWDPNFQSLYIHTFESPTKETRQEAQTLGLVIAPDKKMFQILKEVEDQGFVFYLTIRETYHSPHHFSSIVQDTEPAYSFILRRDDRLPNIDENAGLKKLSFSNSPDCIHIPMSNISLENRKK